MTNSYNDYFKKVKATKAPIRKSNSIGSKPLQNDLSDIEMVRATMDKVKNDRKTKLKKGNSFFQEFPTKVALTLAIGLVVAVWGVVDPQNFEHLFSKVEIGIFSQSLAESAGPAKENSAISEQKSTIEKSPDEAKSQLVKKNWTDEEMSYFRQLNERKLELDSREHELEKLEEELQKQKVEIDSRIKTEGYTCRNF